MATPVPDSYSCASGGSIYGGLPFLLSLWYGALTTYALCPTSYTLGWPSETGATGYEYSLDNGASYTAVGVVNSVNVTGRTAGTTDNVKVRPLGITRGELSLAVTLPATTTTISRTIGTGGYYPTIQAWHDAAPANLVTANQIWEGLCLNQVHTGPSLTPALTMAGSTTDATHYKHLTVAPGCSYADHASRRTNPLRYNEAVGAAISVGSAVGVELDEGYGRVSRLQIASKGNQTTGWGAYAIHSSTPGGLPLTVDSCILESGVADHVLSLNYGAHITRNCLVIAVLPTTATSITPSTVGEMNNGSQVFNTLFVAVGQRYPKATVARTNNCLFKNCGFFGIDMVQDLTVAGGESPGPTYVNCFTDATAGVMPSGCTFMTFDEATGSGFQNKTMPNHDLRLKSTSGLINAGAFDATTTKDITGVSRDATPSVGPWEYTA